MKKIFTLACVLCIACTTINASEKSDTTKTKKVSSTKFKGKPSISIFTNFQQGLFTSNDISSFNLDRASIGYGGTFGDGFAAKIDVDFGATKKVDGQTKRAMYVRNAEVSWAKKGFKVNIGLISLKQFGMQEKNWGYRYIAKSAMDQYKFGSSRDLGFTLSYDIAKWVSIDATMVNGEGYKNVGIDNNYKYAIGATFKPVKGLAIRAYADIYSKNDETENQKNQQTASIFAGYNHDKFSIGAEYDYMWNTKFKDGNSQSIFSVYTTVKVHKQVSIYARYDNYATKNNWGADEQAYYVGVEYSPIKYVSIAPTFSYRQIAGKKAIPIVGLFLDIKL